jgi:tetratricopeptide (TPR) repeat protein
MTPRDQMQCPCDSGLPASACCEQTEAPPGSARRAPDPGLLAQARAAWRGDDLSTATDISLRILNETPHAAEALRLLAEIRVTENKPGTAIALLTRLVKLEPADGVSINQLTMLLLRRGDRAAAEPHARAMVRLSPTSAQAHNLMAMVMTEDRRAIIGEYHCRRALELAGKRLPLLLANLATNLFNQGKIAEARDLYREADEADPHNRQTLLGWARLEEADRQLDAASGLLDRIERFSRDDASVALMRAAILRRQSRPEAALAVLDDAVASGRPARPVESLERGWLLDKLGRHDAAWAEFAGAKSRMLARTGNAYREREALALADALKNTFKRQLVDLLPRAEVRADTAQPIFILGFPRSGTTLLEQTLSGSPSITAGDELPLIHALTEIMPRLFESPHPYPMALADLWMGDHREGLDELRDVYLRRARQLGVMGEGAPWFTDKMPLNEMHMGLISLVFPASPLLHVVRHPLDIMVSAMSNFFSHGAFCSSTLESAARHLILSADLVDHYRGEMDLNYMEVRYEDMVQAQDLTIRKVFDFIGAPFDPAVLSFQENARYARTASYQQVSEGLYDRSRFRYRHYLPHLQPVVPMLTPLIEKLGYEV